MVRMFNQRCHGGFNAVVEGSEMGALETKPASRGERWALQHRAISSIPEEKHRLGVKKKNLNNGKNLSFSLGTLQFGSHQYCRFREAAGGRRKRPGGGTQFLPATVEDRR